MVANQRYGRVMHITAEEAQAQFDELVRRVAAGEEITICRGREPVALLVPPSRSPGVRQIWGNVGGRLGPDFDELPADFVARG